MSFARPWRRAQWGTPLATVLAMLLALAVFAGSEWTYQRALDSLFSMGGRDNARTAVETVMRRLLDVETAQRGYLLTGRAQYLAPYTAAETDMAHAISRLREHHRNDPELLGLVDSLEQRVLEKASEVAETISLYNQGQHDSWRDLLLTDIGREKMESARRIADVLLLTEERRVAAERADIHRILEAGRVGVHALTLLSLLACIFFLRKNAALQASQLEHARQIQAERDLLEQQVRARTGELAKLNLGLQELRDDERSALARALHDELGALLTTAKLDLTRLRHALPEPPTDVTARLQHLGLTLDQGIEMKRRLMESLMPAALQHLGLQAAIEQRALEFRQQTGLAVGLELQPVKVADETLRHALFSVVQGALSNVAQHAHATRVDVSLVGNDTEIVLTLTDNGRGFTEPSGSASVLGLRSLRHRIESLGGRFSVTSAPGEGTQVQAQLPVSSPARRPAGARATTP